MTQSVDLVHDFEKAGFGPGPYVEEGLVEDTNLGLCCDACGQTGLRKKFLLESSIGHHFGVGSECIKKADPDFWLLMKSKYGASSDITVKQVARRKVFDEGAELLKEFRYQVNRWVSRGNRSGYWQYRYGEASALFSDFDRVKRKQQKTLDTGLARLRSDLAELRRKMPQEPVAPVKAL